MLKAYLQNGAFNDSEAGEQTARHFTRGVLAVEGEPPFAGLRGPAVRVNGHEKVRFVVHFVALITHASEICGLSPAQL